MAAWVVVQAAWPRMDTVVVMARRLDGRWLPSLRHTPLESRMTNAAPAAPEVVFARLWGADYLPVAEFGPLVTSALAHRPWFDDAQWALPEEERRKVVVAHLSHAYTTGCVWSVLRGGPDGVNFLGVLLLEGVAHNSANCHFLFFDRVLANKRQLVLAAMADAFQRFDLQALRVEVPTYAADLVGFLRKALGFRFEAEWPGYRHRGLSPTDAKRGSRKVRTIQYKGELHDALLLSVTREGFLAHLQERTDAGTESPATRHLSRSGAPGPGSQLPDEPAGRDAGAVGLPGELRGLAAGDGIAGQSIQSTGDAGVPASAPGLAAEL